jgi:hypothetical protein
MMDGKVPNPRFPINRGSSQIHLLASYQSAAQVPESDFWSYWGVAELRGAGDEPGDGEPLARRLSADAGDDGADAVRPRMEPPPRAEYAAVLRHNVDASAADPEAADQEAAGQEATDQETTDQETTDQETTDPQTELSAPDALQRFEPSRVGLPEVSHTDAATYIDEHQADRPWLAQARDCSPDAQRVIVALDQGHGHAHIRHEGWVTEEMNERRVRNLEDPAQLDPEKREAHVDAFKAGSQSHWCGSIATRITNPEAFATAFAGGVEQTDVRAALDSTGPFPVPVSLPIADLLGEDGHKFCAGSQLEPVNGSMQVARANRDAWVEGDRSVPEPRVRPVETFEGGTVTFTFRPSMVGGYEVNTMYVSPPGNQAPRRGDIR